MKTIIQGIGVMGAILGSSGVAGNIELGKKTPIWAIICLTLCVAITIYTAWEDNR